IHVGSAPECLGYVRAEVFRSHVAVEFGLVHETRGLLARATEKHRPTGGAKAAGQILERCQPRGINRGHIPQAQDHNGRQLVETVCYLGDLVGYSRSEEHTSELQSPCNLVCRLLLEKKKKYNKIVYLYY